MQHPLAPSMLQQHTTTLEFSTRGRGLTEITGPVRRWAEAQAAQTGLLTLWLQHTSASLLVQENADPDVQADLERFFTRLVPDGDPLFRHIAEGADDMPAHVRSALTSVQLSVPMVNGRLALGTWQGLYLWEHRRRGHTRRLVLHLLGA
jgi:secondary thiamine-phosphate synthase enzyme